jgi:hypothetical protein
VRLVAIDLRKVVAFVSGEEEYRVELGGGGKTWDGGCSCPAFEGYRFCKHMVAVALAVGSKAILPDAHEPMTELRSYLRQMDRAALENLVVDAAIENPNLLRSLDRAIKVSMGDSEALERELRKDLDRAIGTRSFIDYARAGQWATGVKRELDALASVVAPGQADIAMRLAAHAMVALEKAVERIDDSEGYLGALVGDARRIHRDSALVVRPEPVALARVLFEQEATDAYGFHDGSLADYADVLGATGLAEYRRLAEQAWKRLPARGPRAGPAIEDYHRLGSILDWFAERDDDIALRIALHRKDLSSQWRYVQLAELCLDADRAGEALRYVEEGLWTFADDPPDEGLITLALELLVREGRATDAEAMAWQVFEKVPTRALYDRLRRLGGEAVTDRAIERLSEGRRGIDAELLVGILMEEGRLDAAWAAADAHQVSEASLLELAEASEATHAGRAAMVYRERIDSLLLYSDNQRYQEAAQLVVRLGKLQEPAVHSSFLDDLRARHGRRRNFMKLLS